MTFTYEENVRDWEVDSNQLSHGILLLRDSKLEHFPVCAEELVRFILDRVELVVKA